MWKPDVNNRTMRILSRLAKIIRDRGEVSFGVLACEANMAPSTLYAYREALLAKFEDIRFDRGTFHALARELVPTSTLETEKKPEGS